jgi:hypothetical protein
MLALIHQGAMLFGLAAVWPSLASGWAVTTARYCALVGLYANWIGAQLAALWSAKGMFVVNGASMPAGAAPWMEAVGRGVVESVDPCSRHVPAHPVGAAREARHLKRRRAGRHARFARDGGRLLYHLGLIA